MIDKQTLDNFANTDLYHVKVMLNKALKIAETSPINQEDLLDVIKMAIGKLDDCVKYLGGV
jgi:hypothetical protein